MYLKLDEIWQLFSQGLSPVAQLFEQFCHVPTTEKPLCAVQRTRERAVAAAAAALLLLSFPAKAAAAAAPHTRRRQLAAHLRAHNRPDVVLALAAVVAQLKSAAQLLVDINKFLIYAKLEIRIACLDLTRFFSCFEFAGSPNWGTAAHPNNKASSEDWLHLRKRQRAPKIGLLPR